MLIISLIKDKRLTDPQNVRDPTEKGKGRDQLKKAGLCWRRRRNVQFLPQLEKIRCRPTGQMLAGKMALIRH